MSCHNVGRALNSVGIAVLRLYDAGRIGFEEAKELLVATRRGVHWCDGNEYEATDEVSKNHCGHCLTAVEVGSPLYCAFDVSGDVPNRYDVDRHAEMPLAADHLCPTCFDRLLQLHTGDPEAGPRERAYIDAHQAPKCRQAIADDDSRIGAFFW